MQEEVWLSRKHAFESVVASETIDVDHLQHLCADGIPDEPSQLRPLMYSLLLGTLPSEQRRWKGVQRQQRESYYALVDSLEPTVGTVLRIKADVERQISTYPTLKRRSHPRRSSRLHPPRKHDVDSDSSSDSISAWQPLTSRRAIFERIKEDVNPRITLSTITNESSTILSPNTDTSLSQFDTHSEVLMRVLAVISAQRSYEPAFVSILAPLYLVYAQTSNSRTPSTFAEEEVYSAMQVILDRTDIFHRESRRCLDTLGNRLKSADEHLHSILVEHELDPASPLYTFRWMTNILSADLPPATLLPIWDALLAAPHLVSALTDMCCAILLASKKHLFRSQSVKGLWDASEEVDFVQVVTFLRNIPVQQIGGIEGIMGAYSALRTILPPSATPQSDLSSRLANLTFSVGPQRLPSIAPQPSTFAPTPPRALMLQEKARRASNPVSAALRRTSTSSSAEGTLSPPPSTGLYRIGSRDSPRRALVYDQMIALTVGLRRRPHIRTFAPLAALVRRYSNYPDHVPLGRAQTTLLAVGSGVVGVTDTSRGDLVATLSESTASTFLPSLHAATIAHPEGRQIMRDRPVVSTKTVNLDYLQQLQRGTLGREYVEWLTEGGLTPDTREKVRYIDSPTLAYTMLRYRQTHDLYHTLFSLPPTLPHELTLKIVELSNMSLPVAGLSSAFGPFRLTNARRSVWLKDWAPWALRVGREGKSLVGVYWEKRWEQGLGDLRRELGVYRNDLPGVESRWRGYRELREAERRLRQKGDWVDEPDFW